MPNKVQNGHSCCWTGNGETTLQSHSETQDDEGSSIVHTWHPGVLGVDIQPEDWEREMVTKRERVMKAYPLPNLNPTVLTCCLCENQARCGVVSWVVVGQEMQPVFVSFFPAPVLKGNRNL